MKISRHIFFILLSLVYLGNCYNRLIYTPPVYLHTALGVTQDDQITKFTQTAKSFIPHRRHLPLTKKIEIGKLYAIKDYQKSSLNLYRVFTIIEYHFSTNYISPLKFLPNNKAPPFFS